MSSTPEYSGEVDGEIFETCRQQIEDTNAKNGIEMSEEEVMGRALTFAMLSELMGKQIVSDTLLIQGANSEKINGAEN